MGVHDGHCAAGWMAPNTNEPSLSACAATCRSREGCGYFAFNGNACAYYTKSAGCPDDNRYLDHTAYKLIDEEEDPDEVEQGSEEGGQPTDFEFVHDGHCAAGWMAPNTNEPSLSACAATCRSREGCGYF